MKQAILKAIDISAGRHIFGQRVGNGTPGSTTDYRPVTIRGTKLAGGSIEVVFGLPHPEEKPAETNAVLTVEFSTAGTKVQPPAPRSMTLWATPPDEDRSCAAVKAALARHLSEKSTEIPLMVDVTSDKQHTTVVVSDMDLTVGHNTMYVVNRKNEVEKKTARTIVVDQARAGSGQLIVNRGDFLA